MKSHVRTFKLIAAVAGIVALVVIFYQNRDPVSTHILFVTVVMSKIVLLLITLVIGFGLGMVLPQVLHWRRP